jgi:hypothetical protein
VDGPIYGPDDGIGFWKNAHLHQLVKALSGEGGNDLRRIAILHPPQKSSGIG